jgi:hypothetical protein
MPEPDLLLVAEEPQDGRGLDAGLVALDGEDKVVDLEERRDLAGQLPGHSLVKLGLRQRHLCRVLPLRSCWPGDRAYILQYTAEVQFRE